MGRRRQVGGVHDAGNVHFEHGERGAQLIMQLASDARTLLLARAIQLPLHRAALGHFLHQALVGLR